MNSDTLVGEGRNIGGKLTETAGRATGDQSLQGAGVSDQISGTVQKGYGAARQFAKDRPFAFAAVAGVVGLALLNTLRGK